MAVVEGKRFSQMLASRKTFAENTRLAKITCLSCNPVKNSVPSVATNKKCETNPIYSVFRPKTTMMMKNEPNSNPICDKTPYFLASGTVGGCLAPTPVVVVFCLTVERRATLFKKIPNEPNLLNAKMNLNPVKTMNYMENGAFSPPKNEPNLKNPQINEKVLLFTPLFSKKQNFSTKRILLFTTFRPEKMRNEPNLKNTKINVSSFITKCYENIWLSGPRKNEPNLLDTHFS